MKKYVIVTDSSCDLEKKFRDRYDIQYLPMHLSVDGTDFEADMDWGYISAKQFYHMMREGKRFISAQVNVESYKKAFKSYVEQGYDVLSLSCSSEISASIKASYIARDEVLAEYPDAKIICVDCLRACFALGILVLHAAELREEGKTIEEVAEWVEKNRLTANMIGSVDKLTWLKQAGRVSAASAFFGGLLNIKPIIIADAKGRNFAMEKVKSRKASFLRIAELMKESYLDVPYQKFFISHADCPEEAEELKQLIWQTLGKEIECNIGYVGGSVGSAVGPGMIGVYFFGKEVTINKD